MSRAGRTATAVVAAVVLALLLGGGVALVSLASGGSGDPVTSAPTSTPGRRPT